MGFSTEQSHVVFLCEIGVLCGSISFREISPMEWTIFGTTWHLAEPSGLVLLAMCVLPWVRSRSRARVGWPTISAFATAPRGRAGWLRLVPSLLLSLAFASLAVAAARPRAIGGSTRIAAKGVAIEVAIDRSTSMTAEDFAGASGTISRLESAKRTFATFVEGRPDDPIGLIAFAKVPERMAAPTLDHAFLIEAARAIRPARIDEDATSLGFAIAFGLGELRPEPSKKKVLILLTDGRDVPAATRDARPIEPEDAARVAQGLGITLHTIAVGRPSARDDGAPADPGPDVERLARIAEIGGGRAFSAEDSDRLQSVFEEIDRLEKSAVAGTVRTRYREGYPLWVGLAIGLIVLERLLSAGPLRRLP